MAIAEFELGLELDSAGESIPEKFLILLALRVAPHGQWLPRPIWRSKGGSHEPDPPAGDNFCRGVFSFFLGVA